MAEVEEVREESTVYIRTDIGIIELKLLRFGYVYSVIWSPASMWSSVIGEGFSWREAIESFLRTLKKWYNP